MRSRATARFWNAFHSLPRDVQNLARKAYRLFLINPGHPGLHFKKIHNTEAIYSVRITFGYRAAGLLEDGEITWFWIGSHADYDRLLRSL